MNNIADAIRRMAQGGRQTVSMVCMVDAVDKEARTVDCTPIDEGAPLLGVNLQANQDSAWGVVIYPRVGSYVVVGFVADGNAGIVLLTDDIESIEVVVSDTTSRVVIDEERVRIDVGDETSAELTKEGVLLNGGSLGGLIKVKELTSRINNIEEDINLLKDVFSGWVSVPQDGGAALKAASGAWAGNKLTLTTRGDYENEKVKQ
ncbi:MAG: hypothetical protein IJY31_03335 [Muribaculaceae bacterium]|nr:hypothetical protein [Muribaculaceae bacterium]